MEHTGQDRLWIWLSSVAGMDAQTFYTLIARFGDGEAVLFAKSDDPRLDSLPGSVRRGLQNAQKDAYIDALFTTLETKGIRAVSRLDADYPAPLHDILLPPPVLYVKGRFPLEWERMVTMVGSRRPTRYGLDAAFWLGKALSEAGVGIVSGLARGIDARSHAGALEGTAPVAGVLGGGVDVIYPREHDRLYAAVAERGCLISEYPPGTRPLPGHFPVRNRILSGLGRAAVVVEAGARSGALITAEHALSQGKDVYAVPGSVFSPACAGSNRLLQDGAALLLKPEDLLEAYGWTKPDGVQADQERLCPTDDPVQKKIFDYLVNEPVPFDDLAEALNMEAGELNSYLTIMELSGIITQLPGRIFTLSRV